MAYAIDRSVGMGVSDRLGILHVLHRYRCGNCGSGGLAGADKPIGTKRS